MTRVHESYQERLAKKAAALNGICIFCNDNRHTSSNIYCEFCACKIAAAKLWQAPGRGRVHNATVRRDKDSLIYTYNGGYGHCGVEFDLVEEIYLPRKYKYGPIQLTGWMPTNDAVTCKVCLISMGKLKISHTKALKEFKVKCGDCEHFRPAHNTEPCGHLPEDCHSFLPVGWREMNFVDGRWYKNG